MPLRGAEADHARQPPSPAAVVLRARLAALGRRQQPSFPHHLLDRPLLVRAATRTLSEIAADPRHPGTEIGWSHYVFVVGLNRFAELVA